MSGGVGVGVGRGSAAAAAARTVHHLQRRAQCNHFSGGGSDAQGMAGRALWEWCGARRLTC